MAAETVQIQLKDARNKIKDFACFKRGFLNEVNLRAVTDKKAYDYMIAHKDCEETACSIAYDQMSNYGFKKLAKPRINMPTVSDSAVPTTNQLFQMMSYQMEQLRVDKENDQAAQEMKDEMEYEKYENFLTTIKDSLSSTKCSAPEETANTTLLEKSKEISNLDATVMVAQLKGVKKPIENKIENGLSEVLGWNTSSYSVTGDPKYNIFNYLVARSEKFASSHGWIQDVLKSSLKISPLVTDFGKKIFSREHCSKEGKEGRGSEFFLK